MPIFEYRCQDCGHAFEELVRSAASGAGEAVACAACGSRGVERLLSVFGVASAEPSVGPRRPPEGPCGTSCACFPQ